MAQNEAGHAKNVGNFTTLLTYCTGYGTRYNPNRESFKLTSAALIKSKGSDALLALKNANAALTIARDKRQTAFNSISPLATRIYGALSASDTTENVLKAASSILKKIRGKRINPIKDTPAAETENTTEETSEETSATDNETAVKRHNSTSQRSFDEMLEHTDELIALLKLVDAYAPNEDDLKITQLESFRTGLASLNNAAIGAINNWDNARLARDRALYAKPNGLAHVGDGIKDYVKSVFGANSNEYKQISKLQFKKYPFNGAPESTSSPS